MRLFIALGLIFSYTIFIISSFFYDHSFMSKYVQWGPFVLMSLIIVILSLYGRLTRKTFDDEKSNESKFENFIFTYTNNYTIFIYTLLLSSIMYYLAGTPKNDLFDITSGGFWISWSIFIIITAVYYGKD